MVVVDCLLVPVLRAAPTPASATCPWSTSSTPTCVGGWLKGPIGLVDRLKRMSPPGPGTARHCASSLRRRTRPGGREAPAGQRAARGPLLDLPAPHDLTTHDPAVLVSLSTFHFAGMELALQRILDATAGLDARVVVTTGPVIDPARLRTAANHEVHRFVPHDELMPQMSLVVGHGGHATTMRALAHDLPLAIMPMHPMLDQPMVGKAVATAGAGEVRAQEGRARPDPSRRGAPARRRPAPRRSRSSRRRDPGPGRHPHGRRPGSGTPRPQRGSRDSAHSDGSVTSAEGAGRSPRSRHHDVVERQPSRELAQLRGELRCGLRRRTGLGVRRLDEQRRRPCGRP